jgi:hypothetical protein
VTAGHANFPAKVYKDNSANRDDNRVTKKKKREHRENEGESDDKQSKGGKILKEEKK